MESLVTSLETSKKLKAAGFPQITSAYWSIHSGGTTHSLEMLGYKSGEGDDYYNVGGYADAGHEPVAAPTAQEIVNQMPEDWYVYISGTAKENIAETLALGWLQHGEVK